MGVERIITTPIEDRIVMMTESSLKAFAKEVIAEYKAQYPAVVVPQAPAQPSCEKEEYGRGIRTIVEMFGVSRPVAMEYKRTFLAPAINQVGKVIVVNKTLARKLFNEYRPNGARPSRR